MLYKYPRLMRCLENGGLVAWSWPQRTDKSQCHCAQLFFRTPYPFLYQKKESQQQQSSRKCNAAEEEAERRRFCVNCNSEDGAASMVSCATCKKGPWHIDCLEPPLEEVPEIFTCKPCHKKANAAGKQPAGSISLATSPLLDSFCSSGE